MKIGTDMKYNYLILALATAALCSCSGNWVETPVNDGETITIRAYQEDATETRTTLIDGGTQVYWEPSDEIKVFFNGSGGRFVAQNTENTDIAEFSGTLNVVVGVNEGAYGSNTLWGLYPYRADAASDGESVTTTLPTEQTGRVGSFAKGTNITLAKSNSFDLAFYNVTGGIRFSLTQEGVKEVVFQGQNDEDIAGKVKLAFANGVPAVQEIIDGQKCITLTAPDGGTFETGKWYYIVALPGSLSNGFKMTFNTETQYATLKSSGSKTIKRGVFGSLADADEDLIYKDKEGGEPMTGNIVFADLAAKYACVAKFDTNGDGEVSIEEAEAATSFSGLFDNWKGVVSFDEIRYFKNVHSLGGVFQGCNKLVSIIVPENINDLGTYTFSDCSSLSSVVLPSDLSAIPNNTFQNCVKLNSVNIPSNVISVEAYAFDHCVSLTSIDLPTALKTIGQYAFYGCSSLTQVDIPDGLTSLGSYAFSGCSKLTTAIIPSGVTSIPAYCFQNCTSLTSVTVPEGITSVGNSAFSNVKMWKLALPSSITSLGSKCFGSILCIILPSTSPVSIQSTTFNDVKVIFVPSNLIEMYGVMTNWANYSSRLRPIDTYREKSEFTLATDGAVNMGSSVKWAAYNVGATKPEEYGNLYAWGEIQTKSNYYWGTYKWCKGSNTTLTKYCDNSSYGYNGFTDNKIVLDLEDDVAHVKWGGIWRLPTDEEWTALRDGCVWEWTTYQGINGYEVYCFDSGNSIFLPASGMRYETDLYNVGSRGYYGSSSLSWNDYYPPSYACCLFFMSDDVRRYDLDRYYGISIRPVCD